MSSLTQGRHDTAHENTKRTLLQAIEKRKNDLSVRTGPNHYAVQTVAHKLFVKELECAILEHTRNAHAKIISRIMELPRELRNNIYNHLWEPTSSREPCRELLYWWESFREPWFSTGDNSFDSPWLTPNEENLRPPHYVDHVLVGKIFAKELLEQLRSTLGTDLRQNQDVQPVGEFIMTDESIQDFVNKDAFEVGITMQELARNLDLRINFQCDAVLNGDDSSNAHTSLHGSVLADRIAQLGAGVDALLGMSHSARNILHDGTRKRNHSRAKEITVILRQEDSFGMTGYDDCLDIVARAYHGLKSNGFATRLQYRSEEIGFNVSFPDDAWKWTMEEWETNMRERNVSKVENQNEFRDEQAKVWKDVGARFFSKNVKLGADTGV